MAGFDTDGDGFNPSAFLETLNQNGSRQYTPSQGGAVSGVGNPLQYFSDPDLIDSQGNMSAANAGTFEQRNQNKSSGDFFTRFADQGGVVKALMAAVGGLGAADLFGGAAGAAGGGNGLTGWGAAEAADGVGGLASQFGADSPYWNMQAQAGGSTPSTFGDDFFNWGSNPAGNNPFAQAPGMGTEGFTTGANDLFNSGNGLANSISPNTLGTSPFGSGVGGTVSQGLGAGSSVWDQLTSFLGKPQIPGLPNSTGGNAAAGLLNYLMKSQQANTLNSAAGQAAGMNNPMNQPQRFPFQSAYTDLMLNPDSYKMTPYAQGQVNMADQQYQASMSKFGPSGTGFNNYLKNFQNILSGDFYKLADQYSTAGGFNQGPGGGGNVFASMVGPAAAAQNSAYEGFGRLLDTTPKKESYQVQFNPQTNSYTYSA